MFTQCLESLGTLFLDILAFMDDIIIAPNISLFAFSCSLSLFALAVALLRGLFGGSDR